MRLGGPLERLVILEVQHEDVVVGQHRRGEELGVLDDPHLEPRVLLEQLADCRRRFLPQVARIVHAGDEQHAEVLGRGVSGPVAAPIAATATPKMTDGKNMGGLRFRFFASEDSPQERHALADVVVGPVTLDREDAVPLGLAEVGDALLDVLGVDPAADGDFAARDAGLLAADRRRQARADVLDVGVGKVLAEPLEVLQRVEAGDERVAGVEVEAEVVRSRNGQTAAP